MIETQRATEHAAPDLEPRAEHQRRRNAALAPILPERVPWPAVAIFTVLALAGAWLVILPLWLNGEGLASPWFQLFAAGMMYTPALAAFVVVLFVKRPSSIPRTLGLGPIRPAGRTIGMTVAALVGLPVLCALAMLLGAALGFIRLDFSTPAIASMLEAAGQPSDAATVHVVAIVQIATIPITALIASVTAFGEEVGWRGWLLPNLLPLGTWPALLISGAIWGVWHAPIILLGYNFGRTDIVGVLEMTAFCVLLGVLFGWLRLRTASVWPAVIAHGALNAAAASLLILLPLNQDAETTPHGLILGAAGWILLAVVAAVLAVTGQLSRRAEPGLRLRESAATAVSPARAEPAARSSSR
ncbi:CPBP family intramembrane metalloprotease [Microbacteriaceae bacterium VKM Ac-2854]|nr:CPBP family intramembrane metalloprotease [Microbacteriaceae bacterium VKM Ac-2854]